MKNRKILLPALLSIVLVFSLILPAAVVGASAAMPLTDDCFINHSAVDSSNTASAIALSISQGNVTPMVAVGNDHIVGLKVDGTVVAAGDNKAGQCDVGGWRDIVQIAVGMYHTVGLKYDGTVVAMGCTDYTDPFFVEIVHVQQGQCAVSGWTDITQVAAGYKHTVGLKSDGTVVAVGDNGLGQCNVADWTDIVKIAAGGLHTVGLRSDGTVVAVGINAYGECDVGNWTDVTQVTAGWYHIVGLQADGTALAMGLNKYGQCDVGNWTDIIQVAAGYGHTVGLKSDGTVVAMGYNNSGQLDIRGWTEIDQIVASIGCTVGLKSDGTVVDTGFDSESELAKWKLLITVPPSDIESVIWGLESYRESSESGKITSFQCSAINATFEGGRISGYAGCNWYEGDYELKGNNLSITRLVSTEMWCGEFVNKIEQAYLTALRDAESYEIEGGKLRINCGNRLLVFNEGYSGTEMWHRWWPMEWWPWIIVAAVVVVGGLVIFLVRRRRHA